MNADFERIVQAHYEGLYRFAFTLVRSEAQACDLAQQTFYRWATKGRQLRDLSKVKTWLYTTLYREFLGSRRRENRFPHHELEAVDVELPVTPPDIVERLDGATVLEALSRVDELYRAPVALFYLEDHSYREIAEILEVPVGTVMSRLARGKAHLRQLLTEPRETAKIIRLPSTQTSFTSAS